MITRQFVYFFEGDKTKGGKEEQRLAKQEEEIEKLQGALQRSQVRRVMSLLRSRVVWIYSEPIAS